MSNDEIKRLAEVVRIVVKEEIKPLNDKVNSLSEKLDANSEELKSVKKEVASNSEELKSVKKEVASNSEEIKSVSEQVAALTVKVDGEIIPTLEIHTKLLKGIFASTEKNTTNISRLDKRLSTIETNAGIQPPSEFQIVR